MQDTINNIGASIGAKATIAGMTIRDRVEAFHADESGGQGGQIAIIAGGLAGIAIAVVAVLVTRASGGTAAIPAAPAPVTTFP